jgi:hypothetical protein
MGIGSLGEDIASPICGAGLAPSESLDCSSSAWTTSDPSCSFHVHIRHIENIGCHSVIAIPSGLAQTPTSSFRTAQKTRGASLQGPRRHFSAESSKDHSSTRESLL